MNRKGKRWLIFPILIFILFYFLGTLYFNKPKVEEPIETQTVDVESLEDFVLNFEDKVEEEIKIFAEFNENEVKIGNSLYYFVSTGAKTLEAYQSCIVESTSLLHPGSRIFLIFITPDLKNILQDKLLSALLSFPNIYIRYIKLKRLLTSSGPDIKNWFINSDFQKSPYSALHLDQVLSYAILKKYGGISLNFDTLLIRHIMGLDEFLIRSLEDGIESHPIGLHHNHQMFDALLNKLKHYEGNSSNIGSQLLTQVAKEECQVEFIKQLEYKQCRKLPKILPSSDFVPIEEQHYRKLYDPARTKLVLKTIKEHQSFGLKLWTLKPMTDNLGSRDFNTTFYALASQFCPMNVRLLGPTRHF